MGAKNTSDSIEAYIKSILTQAGMVELKRSELADVFQVVPSQINYVIKTRFTESRSYTVESKHGGGGYIQIEKIEFSDRHQMLCGLYDSVGERVSSASASRLSSSAKDCSGVQILTSSTFSNWC